MSCVEILLLYIAFLCLSTIAANTNHDVQTRTREMAIAPEAPIFTHATWDVIEGEQRPLDPLPLTAVS